MSARRNGLLHKVDAMAISSPRPTRILNTRTDSRCRFRQEMQERRIDTNWEGVMIPQVECIKLLFTVVRKMCRT